ncbi:hypothetical protein [Parabacteroides sp.]
MKKISIYMALAGIILGTGGCSNEYEEVEPEAAIEFRVSTRADVPQNEKQLTRLFLVERLPEHEEGLHCGLDHRYDLEGNTYRLEALWGQWYKFAFVCVPAVNDEMGGTLFKAEDPANTQTEHDFNKLMVDFVPVLAYQGGRLKEAQSEDLAVYRKIIDRWIDPVNPSTEDVILTRVTGELILDMGIPADQFEKPVKSIQLNIPNTVVRLYIHDSTEDEVLTEAEDGADGAATRSFEWALDTNDPTEQNTRQVFKLVLLPGELRAAFIIVEFSEGNPQTFTLQNDNNAPVLIKKNIRTKVLFNGMHSDEFEIRYAGFDDKAEIDVPGDDWNGWH